MRGTAIAYLGQVLSAREMICHLTTCAAAVFFLGGGVIIGVNTCAAARPYHCIDMILALELYQSFEPLLYVAARVSPAKL